MFILQRFDAHFKNALSDFRVSVEKGAGEMSQGQSLAFSTYSTLLGLIKSTGMNFFLKNENWGTDLI